MSGLAPAPEFERLSVEHGLSQSTVNRILQDREGYMWFATLNGLNKYDGYRFVDFRHNPNDPNSISSDQIYALYEDNKGNLWVGTQEGLNRFDPTSDSFIVYKHDPGDPSSLSNNIVLAIFEDRSGALWIGTGNGLNRFDKKQNKFQRYQWSPNNSVSLSHNSVSAIFEDKDGNLWVGTNGGGLNKFDPDRTSITHYFQMGRAASLTYVPPVVEAVNSLANNRRAVSSILHTGNLQSISQEFELREQSDILLVSVGEGTDKMYDFGWLERDGKKIWAMELDRTKHAGGHPKNRIQVEVMTLQKGKYTLCYQSDDSHSYKNWNRLPPQNPGLWGVQAIPISEDEAGFFHRHLKKYVKPSAPSSNRIASITQDDDGILWIGTRDGGLNKLEFGTNDGFVAGAELESSAELGFPRFSVYRTIDPELRKIYSEEVFNFIDMLNYKKRRIEAILKAGDFRSDESNFEIPEDAQVLVVAMAEGLTVMDDTALLMRDKKVIWEMKPEKTYHAGGAFKNRIQIEVLALTSGAYKLQFRSDDLHSFDNWNDLPPTYPDLWGVQIFRLSTSEVNWIKKALNKNNFSHTIASNGVRSIQVEENGDLWIATSDGLSRLDRSTGLFTNFKNDPKNPASLSVNEVQTVYQDKSGTLWIGTVLGGINKLNRNKNRFPKYTANPFVKNSLQNRIVYSFHEGREGLIWVGTRTGLSLFDPSNKEFFNFETSPVLAELQNYPIMDIDEDRNGNLWIATGGGGLFRFNPMNFHSSLKGYSLKQVGMNGKRGAVLTNYSWKPSDPQTLSSNNLYTIFHDSEGVLWVGTVGGGLNKLETDELSFSHFVCRTGETSSLSHNGVRTIYEDRSGYLWIGTNGGGLNRFDRTTGKFVHFKNNPNDPNSLSHNAVTSIYEQDSRYLWTATYGGGLNRMDRETNTFTRYTEKDGLPNNVVYSILPDDSGNLWLSTNKGLSRFTLPKSALEGGLKGVFKNYDMENGLQSYEFNTGAYLKCRGGSLLFGGIDGFNIINPDQVRDNPDIPEIVITNVKKFDQVIKFDKSISQLPEIVLTYQENFISFEFAALDYTNPEKNRYAYKLESFETDWIYCANRRYASYTNLDPGEYTFRVKGSNNDGVWNEQGAAIKIKITPPFWMTWWFFTSVCVFFVSGLVAVHKYRLQNKVKQSIMMERVRFSEREKVREQVSRDYHDELGHKLTKISLFSELIKRNINGGSNEIKKYLDKVIRSSESLSGDTRDFIWTINPEKDSIYDLVLYLKEFGDALFEETDIHFEVKNLSQELRFTKLPMEWKRQLMFIFKEGMNNVLKHSNCQNVVLAVRLRNVDLYVKLADDGLGFDPSRRVNRNGSGNGLPNMSARAAKISSEIDFNSGSGRGTKILFRGKIPTNGY